MEKILLLNDCLGCETFAIYKDNKQYTEGYETLEELKENHNINTIQSITFKNIAGIKITITGDIEKIDTDIIEQLKEYNGTIYWSDTQCLHYMFMFKINNLWFESININNELTHIELLAS